MKSFYIIFCLCLSIHSYSQQRIDSPFYLHFNIEKNDVVFREEYGFKTLNADTNYNHFISTIESIKNFHQHTIAKYNISGYLKDIHVNYRKYGGSFAWTASYLHYPLSANVNIVINSQKYIVTISNIYFYHLSKHKFIDIATTKDHMKFKDGKTVTESLKYLDSYLSNLFSSN